MKTTSTSGEPFGPMKTSTSDVPKGWVLNPPPLELTQNDWQLLHLHLVVLCRACPRSSVSSPGDGDGEARSEPTFGCRVVS